MKLLVVEDDRKVAGFIEQGLREEGYAVDIAPDGDEATMLAHVYDYDLVVLDVMLPKKNGLQVAAELRREGRRTPILLLTARGPPPPDPHAGGAGRHGGCGARPRRRRRRLPRQAVQVRRAAGAGAGAVAPRRRGPDRPARLRADRAGPPEAQGAGDGQGNRSHAQGIPSAGALPAARRGSGPPHRAAREGVGHALRPREQRGRRPCRESAPQASPGGRTGADPHRTRRRV